MRGVSELDETFVLECYKDKPLSETVKREARKHGAKAQRRGISSEYVCICTGIQRKWDAYAATANWAKPDAAKLAGLFANHIASGHPWCYATGLKAIATFLQLQAVR